jgi:hypothetical protein
MIVKPTVAPMIFTQNTNLLQMAVLTQVSKELAEDSVIDFGATLARDMAFVMAKEEDRVCFNNANDASSGITGALWAETAWGSYWSWDPKETWSLITWFVYAAFLHARFTRDWRGSKAAILSIVGFIFVLFTYFGVNYIISGLHSYA